MQVRQRYTKEFKLEAIRQLKEGREQTKAQKPPFPV